MVCLCFGAGLVNCALWVSVVVGFLGFSRLRGWRDGFPVLDVFMVCIYGGLRVVWFLAFMVVCDCFLGFLVFRVLGLGF